MEKIPVSKDEMPRWKAYIIFFSTLSLIWVFMIYLGPWLETQIPIFSSIVKVIEERELNANAYFYTEIEASYDGERYLVEALKMGVVDNGISNYANLLAIFLCFAILYLGFRTLPLK